MRLPGNLQDNRSKTWRLWQRARSLNLLDAEPPAECLEHLGAYSGELLIVSTGHTCIADLAAYKGTGDVMGVKEVGMTLFPMHHWFSGHCEFWDVWEEVRRIQARNLRAETEAIEPVLHCKQGGDRLPWPINGAWGQDTGLSATILGVLLGYDRVILAGMPADGGGHFYPWTIRRPHEHVQAYGPAWTRLRDEFFEGKVTSLSGNTKEILGTP